MDNVITLTSENFDEKVICSGTLRWSTTGAVGCMIGERSANRYQHLLLASC